MKKFFIKHKTKLLILSLVIAVASLLTAVSIALWNSDSDEQPIYTVPVNPNEKYLEYYYVVENPSSINGFDYYPISRLPEGLEVEGLAVARYSGFMTEVEIPAYYNGYPIIHLLASNDYVNNGFGTVTKVIVPETMTYIANGALLDTTTLYVLGKEEYTYTDLSVSGNEVEIKDGNSNLIDKLVLTDGLYLSTITLDTYAITNNTIDYECGVASIVVLDTTVTGSLKVLGRLSGDLPTNTTFENDELRKNNISYTLNNNDLFGNDSGAMISDGGNNYHKYIITKEETTVTIGSSSEVLEGLYKYLVSYDGINITLTKYEYKIGDVVLTLDTSNTSYERYVNYLELNGDISVTLNGSEVYSKENALSGTYTVTYSPNVLLPDLDTYTNLSIDNIYYLYSVNQTLELDMTTVDFILPDSLATTYYAIIDNEPFQLTRMCTSHYYLTLDTPSNVRVLGYNDDVLVFESGIFNVSGGNTYDLTITGGDLILSSEKYHESLYDFKVNLPLSFAFKELKLVAVGSYYDVHNSMSLTTDATTTFNITCDENGDFVISYDTYKSTFLANALALSNEYIFSSLTLSLYDEETLVKELYSYTYSDVLEGASSVEFYGKEYILSYQITSSETENIYYIFNRGILDRNFANTSILEYYGLVSSGSYFVSTSNDISNVNNISLYEVTGEKVLQFADGNIKDSSRVYYNGNLLVNVGDSFYQGYGHVESANIPSASYFIYYDGSSNSFYRVEGSKKYYISGDNVTFTLMKLNSSTTDYEEYIIENYSLPSGNVYIKSDLDLSATLYENVLEAGLHSSITFSVDNRRRAENNYEITSYFNYDKNADTITVTLSDGSRSVSYYLPESDPTLPSFENIFTLSNGYRFDGWLNSSSVISTLGIAGETYTASLTQFVSVSLGNGYSVLDEEGNPISSLELGDEFKVVISAGYSLISVKLGDVTLEDTEGVYSISEITSTELAVNVTPNTYTITLDGNGGSVSSSISTVYGEQNKLPVPTGKDGFLYYYDKVSGIVYTDNGGNLISPYIVKSDLALTAVYTDTFYLIINKFDSEGNYLESNITSHKTGDFIKTYIPLVSDDSSLRYSKVSVYQTTNGYPVEFDIYEYEHMYSFEMPSGNVIMNITYVPNDVEDQVESGETTTLYALINTSAYDVEIYDSVEQTYKKMMRLHTTKQIYQGFVAYEITGFDKANTKIKFRTNTTDESYVYTIDYATNNLIVIDNHSLDNETHLLSNWIDLEQVKNEFTVTSEFSKVVPLNGNISVTNNVITVTKALNKTNESNYQYASFEVVLNTSPIKLSCVISYSADGSEDYPILINDAADFNTYMGNELFAHLSGLYFLQTAENIEVSDSNNYNVAFNRTYPFNHTYDGGNETEYNEIVYTQTDLRDNVNNGLFGYIGPQGTVKNLYIDYDILNPNSVGGFVTKNYIGAIASVNDGIIDNVGTRENSIIGHNLRYVGGLVGINTGTIKNSANNISYSLHNYGVTDSNILGGICGYNGGKITNSVNNGSQVINSETKQELYSQGSVALNRGSITNTSSSSDYNTVSINKAFKSVKFSNNWNWSGTIYAYAFSSTSSETNASWPGVEMTYTGQNSSNEAVFEIYLDSKFDRVIFNNNGTNQTVDVDISYGYEASKYTKYANYYVDGESSTEYVPNTSTKKNTVGVFNICKPNSKYVIKGSDGSTIYMFKGELVTTTYSAIGTQLTAGVTYQLVEKSSGDIVDGYNIVSRYSAYDAKSNITFDGSTITCKKDGLYDLYFEMDDTVGVKPNQLEEDTIKATFVDDWYFVNKEYTNDKGTYYLKSAVKVDYYDATSGGNKIATLVYSGDQVYQSNGMNTVMIDVFEGSKRVEISRVMLINNYEAGMDRFYFSFDESTGFERISNEEFVSYPDNTYTVSVDVSSSIPSNIYVYSTNSQSKYATTNISNNSAKYVESANKSVVSYVDVIGLEAYDSFRVIYQTGAEGSRTDVEVISYNRGEQIQLLSGITNMIFEVSLEGNGVKRIAAIEPDTSSSTITFTPITGREEQDKSPYALRVNGQLVYMSLNPSNNNQYMTTALEINTSDSIEVVSVSDSGVVTKITGLNKDSYSTTKLSILDNKLSFSQSNIYDVYYTPSTKYVYVGVATLYELLYADGSTVRMYANPSNNDEVMATSLAMENGDTLQLRIVGNKNVISNLTLDSASDSAATITGSTITFSENNTFDIYVNKANASNPIIYVGDATAASYDAEFSGTKANSTAEEVVGNGDTISFKFISNYNNGRVYYLNSSDEIIGYYAFDSSTTSIPCVDDAVKLEIVKISGSLEINRITVNAIYPEYTLMITNPYYGYYDVSYISDNSSKQYLFFNDSSSEVYINYILNDGRTGSILMEKINDNYHKIDWARIIGLNPKSISFVASAGETNSVNLLDIDISTANCYSILLEEKLYNDYNEIYLYVDENAPLWNEYYVLISDVSYRMEEIGDRYYYAYVPLELTDSASFKLMTNPNASDVFITDEITYDSNNNCYVIRELGSASGSVIEKFESKEDITSYDYTNTSYEHYLLGSFNGYQEETKYGMSSIIIEGDKYYYGFVQLVEPATYQIGSLTGTLPSGKHMLVYDRDSVKVYTDELMYEVTYIYGNDSIVQYYSVGSPLVFPEAPVMDSTARYDFAFNCWNYDGMCVAEGYKVVSDMTLYASFTADLRKYNVTFNSTGYEKTVLVSYGKRMSEVQTTEHQQNTTGETGWFKGWYLDENFNIAADNLAVTENATLYAKWYIQGMYLVGVIEGYTSWDEPDLDYKATLVTENAKSQYEIEYVYLEPGDEVTLRHFYADGNNMLTQYYDNWATDSNTYVNESDIDTYGNYEIPKKGYYNFYLHWDGYNDGYLIYVTYQEFVINLEPNTGLINGIDKPDYFRFNLDEDETLNLYSSVDDAPATPNALLPTATNINDQVLYGWFNRPVGGERITSLTRDMMDKRNSYTLYAQYITAGYYLNGDAASDRITNTSKDLANAVEYTEGATITIYHFEGSIYGSSPLGNAIAGNNNLSVSGNTVTINETGEYVIYLDENGVLTIDQYHTVTYITGPIGAINSIREYEVVQLYGTDLVTLDNPIEYQFIGWLNSETNDVEIVGTDKVIKNTTYYALYQYGSLDDVQ